jgi:membrane-associated phospholipid phosphatase
MNQFLLTLPSNVIRCFKGWMILWHIIAIILTFLLVTSGFDWFYFRSTRGPLLRAWMFPAVIIGQFLPLLLPFVLFAIGGICKNTAATLAAWAVGQAELIGLLVSSACKALTGRAHPAHGTGADLTHVFHFGFLRGGMFWGWPSSHTTIAFAMAAAVFALCPNRKWPGYLAFAYALYIGIGVSMTIHWFSDFAAGAIIGTVIGTVVGKSCLRPPA